MSLPSPTFTFTIPSIHDDTILNCRLYVPGKHFPSGNWHSPGAAIIAHPYAPLGGCYDDPIVQTLAMMLLKAGYVICTFNFRGASGAAGHTSWSAKPELGDCTSLFGFMIHFLNGLMRAKGSHVPEDDHQLSTVPSGVEGDESLRNPSLLPRLILAGYSYGSMIASHLPSIERVIRLFENAGEGSAESEIMLRASHLSAQTLKDVEAKLERSCGRLSLSIPASQSSILVGGFESGAAEQRIEREARRSLDVRKSLDRVREKLHIRQHPLPSSNGPGAGDGTEANSECKMMVPQICYLLISPILGPVAAFATIFSHLSFKGRQAEKHISDNGGGHELASCPTLAVYGSKDFFTSVKKLRAWAEGLSRLPGSTFQYHEVAGAGHFWREAHVLEEMTNRVKEWESSL